MFQLGLAILRGDFRDWLHFRDWLLRVVLESSQIGKGGRIAEAALMQKIVHSWGFDAIETRLTSQLACGFLMLYSVTNIVGMN